MRVRIHDYGVTLWLSANDTYEWARQWPCSELRGKAVVACFDSGGLCDLSINGGRGSQDCDGNEFSAICADHLRAKLPKDHPAYFVAVGQFERA